MNKWKIAFWICFLALIVTAATGLYVFVDQSVTIGYMREGYTNTENDLEELITIINQTDLSKTEVTNVLKHKSMKYYVGLGTDTISLDRITLYFSEDTLKKIDKQW